jgi:hypothetical protein
MNGKRLTILAAAIAASVGAIAWLTSPREAPGVVPAVPPAHAPVVIQVPPAAAPAPVVVAEQPATATVDWDRRYRESADFFALSAEMAGAALGGDDRAAYVIGRVLLECQVDELILRPYGDGTVADRVEAYFVAAAVVSEPRRAEFRRRVARCERLFSGDPFVGLDLPDEAREFQYWRDLALTGGDSLAIMDRASRHATQYGATDDPERARQYREELLQDVRVAVASRDPAALLAIGGLLTHPSLVDGVETGLAWWAAACQSGYDCSNANPDIGHGCGDAGTCEPGSTILDTLQRDLGPAKYAAIYAAGQDILYKVTNDDWDGLQPYLAIK